MEAMLFAEKILSNNGQFISKIFMGPTFNEIILKAKSIFKVIKVYKPKSSRKSSKESFIICKNLR
jgi:23S rRNA (uridine2552-2'-O)-methyltransferase